MTLSAIIAANRFGLGARPGELTDIADDAKGWLIRQVEGTRPVPQEVAALRSSATAFQTFAKALRERRQQGEKDGKGRQQIGAMYRDQVAARYRLAIRTEEPFRERLVHFWTNHFAVSADKAQVVGLAATLENEAIRPNLGGRFVDLLLAVEAHPAMILYLDNQASIGPNSPLAQRAARRANSDRKLDINENLAREILELHTLGVNGGYSQTDVTTFARALTGWSVAAARGKEPEQAGQFQFRQMAHEPGSKTILGKRYSEDGLAQPRAVLKDLADHPATAKHLATKLARHFIADEPPESAVSRLAKVFRDTGGDLPALHRALVECPEAWARPTAKFKTPHDFVVSTFRMLDFVPPAPEQMLAPFQLLGQRPYTPGSPAGWPDTASQWDGPDALLKRIEWASAVGKRMGSKVQPLDVGAASLGSALAERTRVAISRAESGAQGMALLLASPEFQRR
ncbi:hypothetical protein GCM10011487_10340 [Steroidobacter agaridevorans]|uniref:DUF1800 domain-containing protein n=1 Tax=Steroidobacter agaridevorans TaxID=2695856 RepID=A0A829Y6Z7_9GAMM|nr:DUF1800 domain-containing protein [Steroidobacter agaridevorans]GFE79034.1 hypothetical protein GCM10011487_10340 [Steroidobacter agaridevorans]